MKESISAMLERNVDNLVVPAFITSLTPYSLAGFTQVNTIVLPTNLNKIDKYAFYNNSAELLILNNIKPCELDKDAFYKSNLKQILVPRGTFNEYRKALNWSEYAKIIKEADYMENNRSIVYALYNKNLNSIDLSKQIFLGDYALYGQSNLKDINLKSCISLGSYSLSACSNLKSLYNLDKLNEIHTGAFCECRSINNLKFNIISVLESRAFRFCLNLKSVDLSKGTFTVLPYYCFDTCPELTEILLPKSLKVIDRYSIQYCNKLETLTIPKEVYSINSNAIGFNERLREIYIESDIPPKIKSDSIDNNISLESIYLSKKAYDRWLKLAKTDSNYSKFLPYIKVKNA